MTSAIMLVALIASSSADRPECSPATGERCCRLAKQQGTPRLRVEPSDSFVRTKGAESLHRDIYRAAQAVAEKEGWRVCPDEDADHRLVIAAANESSFLGLTSFLGFTPFLTSTSFLGFTSGVLDLEFDGTKGQIEYTALSASSFAWLALVPLTALLGLVTLPGLPCFLVGVWAYELLSNRRLLRSRGGETPVHGLGDLCLCAHPMMGTYARSLRAARERRRAAIRSEVTSFIQATRDSRSKGRGGAAGPVAY